MLGSSTGRASTTTSRRGAARSANPRCRRAHVGQRPQQPAKPSDLDAQPRAMRFVGELRPERSRDERVPRHIRRPRLAQRAREREQHRTRRERDRRASGAHDVTAGVDDEGARRQQRFDLVEQEQSLLAARNQACRRRVQHARRSSRPPRSAPGCRPAARRASARASAARAAFVRRRRIAMPATTSSCGSLDAGGRDAGSSACELALGVVEPPDQEQAPDLEVSRVRGIDAVAVLLERRARRSRASSRASPGRARRVRSRPRRRRTARGRRLLSDRTRAPRVAGAPSRERDRRAAPSRCRAARAPARRRAARPASARRADRPPRARAPRRDQRVHRNPATLVTPTVRDAGAQSIFRTNNGHVASSDSIPAERRQEHDEAQDRDTRRMARSAARAARGGEGAHAAQRRAGAAAAGAAVGADRQGVSIRHRRGQRVAGGSLPGRSQLLVYHFMFGPDYTAGCPSCSAIADGFNGFVVHLANHDVHAVGGVARAAREAAGVQAADGLDVPVGVVVRQRLQLRLQRLRSPRSSSATAASNTTTGARQRGVGRAATAATGRSPSSRPRPAPTWPPTRASGPA